MIVREIIRHNLGWKVAALVAATMIWFAIDKGERIRPVSKQPGTVERGLRAVPVRWLVVSPGKTAPGKLNPASVTVVVAGPESVLSRLPGDELVAFVRATGSGPAAGFLPVEVRAPAEVRIESITPTHVSVEIPAESGKAPALSN